MNEMLSSFLIAFGGNLLSSLVLILGIYHQVSKRRDYVFTFILVSTAIFLLCNLLMGVEIDLAFALGFCDFWNHSIPNRCHSNSRDDLSLYCHCTGCSECISSRFHIVLAHRNSQRIGMGSNPRTGPHLVHSSCCDEGRCIRSSRSTPRRKASRTHS